MIAAILITKGLVFMHTVIGCQLAWQAGDPEKDWIT